jgi:hypothetical protein
MSAEHTQHTAEDSAPVRDVEGRDWVVRTLLPMEQLAEEPGSKLARLAALWTEAQATRGGIPDRKFVDPITFARLRLVGSVHIIDVSADDPQDYRIKVHGTIVTQLRQADLTGTRLGDMPNRLHAKGLAVDYLTTKLAGVPRYQRIEASYNFSVRDYRRLILPVASAGTIDTLVVAVQSRETDTVRGKPF